jgi:hypothetical protein
VKPQDMTPFHQAIYGPPPPTASPSDVRKAFGFPSHCLFICGEAEPRRYFLRCIVTERQSLSAHQATEPLDRDRFTAPKTSISRLRPVSFPGTAVVWEPRQVS